MEMTIEKLDSALSDLNSIKRILEGNLKRSPEDIQCLIYDIEQDVAELRRLSDKKKVINEVMQIKQARVLKAMSELGFLKKDSNPCALLDDNYNLVGNCDIDRSKQDIRNGIRIA